MLPLNRTGTIYIHSLSNDQLQSSVMKTHTQMDTLDFPPFSGAMLWHVEVKDVFVNTFPSSST